MQFFKSPLAAFSTTPSRRFVLSSSSYGRSSHCRSCSRRRRLCRFLSDLSRCSSALPFKDLSPQIKASSKQPESWQYQLPALVRWPPTITTKHDQRLQLSPTGLWLPYLYSNTRTTAWPIRQRIRRVFGLNFRTTPTDHHTASQHATSDSDSTIKIWWGWWLRHGMLGHPTGYCTAPS